MNSKITIYVVLFCAPWLFCQSLSFDHYGLNEGLSQQTIRCIAKSSDGFLWLGTQDGLNRFDGKNFRIYHNDPKDSLSISGNFINRILEDHQGNLWVATGGNGVCRFDPTTDTFRSALTKGNHVALAIDTTGNIYTNNGPTGLVVLKKEDGYAPTYFDLLSSTVTAIAIEQNTIIIGTKDGQLLRGQLNDLNRWAPVAKTLPGSIQEIVRFQQDWLVGTSRGLFFFNETKEQSWRLNVIEHDSTTEEVLFIESIQVHGNSIYLGTDNGFYILSDLDRTNRRFSTGKVYKGDLEDPNTITSNRVYDILIEDGLIFIGTNNLDIASVGLNVFKTINPETKPGLNNNYVFSIFKKGDLLFVGTRKGINIIDGKGNTYLISKKTTDQQLAYDVIRGMAADNDNNLWIATTKGISIVCLDNFDPERPVLKSFYFDENNPHSLSNDKCRSVYKDHKGTMWVCTYGGGLNRFTGNLEKNEISFERYTMARQPDPISSDFVYNIVDDRKGNYWISSENGLNRLTFAGENYQDPIFTSYTSNDSEGGIKNNSVLNTFVDSEQILWVATQSGIHKYIEQKDTFAHYGKEQGLSNDYVYNIVEDVNGLLWMGTNNGLFRFDRQLEKFTHFTVNDGLQSSEFNLGAHFYDTNTNTLYFGGINGFNVFQAENVAQLDREGNLSLTSLKIKNRDINPITNPNILDISFSRTKEIKLQYDDFPCYIQFTDFDYGPNKNTTFDYSLGGGGWNTLGTTNELQILQLPKGEHTLKLQGSSRNGFWKKEPLELKIKVIPPWYNSNLAYFFYALIVLSTGYLLYRFRLHQKMAFQEATRLKELDTLKSKFITNITHEFRTPLTVILGYLNTLNNEFGNHTRAKLPLKSIEQNSKSLLKLVNEMLDLAKLETGNLKLNPTNIDLVAYTSYIVQSFSSLAKAKKIKLKFIKASEHIQADVDTEKMRQILYNLISNAIKFSEDGGTVKVLIDRQNDWANLTIQDQGIGIPKGELPFVFDRFYRSSKTAKKASGTGIGLSLTKELIALMNGKITVHSVENMGTTFKLKLPISNCGLATNDTIEKSHLQVTLEEQPKITDTATSPSHVYTILVVEDNTDIATYIGSCLDADYNLLFAYNGSEGYEMAYGQIPDIILTDVMMPEMDGYELTQKLQQNSVTNHIPVVMLTAKSLEKDRLQGLKSGADAYLIKPFSEEELVLRISKLIEKRKVLQLKYQNAINRKPSEQALQSDKNLRFLNKLVDFVKSNIDNSGYDSGRLAKDIGMSESQLYRKLKATTNKSTAIFIRHVRLERAKELLQNQEKTVAEIAFETGFNDPNWFSKVFKESFGMSPTEYRK